MNFRIADTFTDSLAKLIYVVVGDEEKGRVDISALNTGLAFPGIETVRSHMVVAKRDDLGRKIHIRHGKLKDVVAGNKGGRT